MNADPHDPKDPAEIRAMASDPALQKLARDFFLATCKYRYSYHFSWLGRPVIQYPQDLIAMQELIWQLRPELIVETGVAHGGSLIYYASLLQLIGNEGLVAGIDVDIRAHNRAAIEAHPLAKRIALIEGSSVGEEAVARVKELARDRKRTLVVLDSSHTHDHVLRELQLYSPFVKHGSYIVVYDTVIEYMPASAFPDRPWGPGNNPLTAVRAFLERNPRFAQDESIDATLLISAAPGGYLRCIKD